MKKDTGKKVIVTGGAGFIGSHIVDALVERDFTVHVIDNLSAGKRENVNAAATLHVVDMCDAAALEKVFADVAASTERNGTKGDIAAVFHLAALPQVQYSIEHPDETHRVNVGGMINVLMSAAKHGVKKVVYSSSTAIYGDQEVSPIHEELLAHPKSPYALQKYEGELLVRLWSELYNLPGVSLRYFNAYGPRQSATGAYPSAIMKFLELKHAGKPITIVGTGKQTRDFVHVRDIVRANMLAMDNTKVGNGDVFNVGTGVAISVNELAALIGGPVEYIAPRVEIEHSLADFSKARRVLGWEPQVSFEAGINELKSLPFPSQSL